MDRVAKTAVSGVAGTLIMTAGSELMSLMANENFSEPAHLETMISRLVPTLSKHAKKIAGWGAHFAMGLVFAAIYVELWETKKVKHNLKNALILGALSGVIGLFIWKATFKIHPLPPWLNYTHFYLQRIPAHIVFAVGAMLAYKLTLYTAQQQTIDKV